jgi:hypothetical protein
MDRVAEASLFQNGPDGSNGTPFTATPNHHMLMGSGFSFWIGFADIRSLCD